MVLDKLSSENHEASIKLATVLWGIWFARNQKVWENKTLTPSMAVAWSSKQITEWREAWKNRIPNSSGTGTGPCREDKKWVPPREGRLKLNVDASVGIGSASFSVGMVLRDHSGRYLKGKNMRFDGAVSVVEAES